MPDRPRDGGGAAGAAGAVSDRAVPGDEVRGGDRYPMWVALRERLPVWVQLRCGLEPRTLAALAVVLVAAAVFAALHFWAGRPQTVRPPELVHQGAAARPGPPAGVPARLPAAEGERAARIVVDVSGKVLRPGCSGCRPVRGWPTPWLPREASGPGRTSRGSTGRVC